MTSPVLLGLPLRSSNRHARLPGVPEHEEPESFLRRQAGFVAGVDKPQPWLVGHAEGAFVVSLVRHVSHLPWSTDRSNPCTACFQVEDDPCPFCGCVDCEGDPS